MDDYLEILYDLPLTKDEKIELSKNYEEVVINLERILVEQNKLRLLCRFKILFGYIETPAVYKEDFVCENEDSDDKSITSIDDPSESENENVTNEERVTTTEVIEAEIESNVQNVEKTADMEKMMKQLEILKKQFAEIKAENETLKESIEQILESKTVF